MSAPVRAGPPGSIAELEARARGLGGRTVSWVAASVGLTTPPDLRSHKGWLGQLIEVALGADGGSIDGPDFLALGVELKTLPIDARAEPRESTWVCSAALDGSIASRWDESRVCRKLACVLWVPVVLLPGQSLGDRRLGAPVLWRPNALEEATLRADWEELSALIRAGDLEHLDARAGQALHLRPKAANAREMVPVLDDSGDWVETNPRGFYLRRSFTARLLKEQLGWSSPGTTQA